MKTKTKVRKFYLTLQTLSLGETKPVVKVLIKIFLNKKTPFTFSLKISDLPKEVFNLISLKELWMAENNFTSISSEANKLTKLTDLVLNSNKLTSLSSSAGDLEMLRFLELSHNELKNILSSLGSMPSLITRAVGHNKICSAEARNSIQNFAAVCQGFDE